MIERWEKGGPSKHFKHSSTKSIGRYNLGMMLRCVMMALPQFDWHFLFGWVIDGRVIPIPLNFDEFLGWSVLVERFRFLSQYKQPPYCILLPFEVHDIWHNMLPSDHANYHKLLFNLETMPVMVETIPF